MMTLKIEINGQEIQRIDIVNNGIALPYLEKAKKGLCEYEITAYDFQDKSMVVAGVDHKREDGAQILAMKVLKALNEQ